MQHTADCFGLSRHCRQKCDGQTKRLKHKPKCCGKQRRLATSRGLKNLRPYDSTADWNSSPFDCRHYISMHPHISSVPAETVTISILNYELLHSLCCLTNGKVKSFKQTVFLSAMCSTKNYKCSTCSLSTWTQTDNTIASSYTRRRLHSADSAMLVVPSRRPLDVQHSVTVPSQWLRHVRGTACRRLSEMHHR